MNLTRSSLVCSALLILFAAPLAADDNESAKVDADKYQEVELETLRITPEDFKNKRVRAATYYVGLITSFPEYMEKSGFRSGKHYLVRVVPRNLPAISRKNDPMTETLAAMKKGQVVNVYGRVKEFRVRSKGIAPQYYLDLEHLEVVADAPELELTPDLLKEANEEGLRFNDDDRTPRPPPRQRRPWRR